MVARTTRPRSLLYGLHRRTLQPCLAAPRLHQHDHKQRSTSQYGDPVYPDRYSLVRAQRGWLYLYAGHHRYWERAQRNS